MLDPASLQSRFEQGLTFQDFVRSGEPEGHHLQWNQRFGQLALDDDQRRLVESFTRSVRLLCLTGAWCGDCALQGAAMARIEQANPARVQVRFLDRAAHADLQVRLPINAGLRVPVSLFLAEDFEPVSRFGDRTLSRYRSMARKALGDRAPVLAQPPPDPVRAGLNEVLGEFERVHLLLRLSTRLRERHAD